MKDNTKSQKGIVVKLENELIAFPTLEEKVNFITNKHIDVTPEVIALLMEHGGHLSGYIDIPDKVIRLIKLVLKDSKINSILDPFCCNGILLYHLGDFGHQVGYEYNQNMLKLARLLNPIATLEQLDVLQNPIIGKYDAIVTTNTPLGPNTRQFAQLVIQLLNENLNKNGLLILLAPSNLLTAPAFVQIRETITKKSSLEMTASLKGLVRPFMGLDINLIVIKNAKQREQVFLGDLSEGDADALYEDYKYGNGDFWVPSKNMKIRWDRNFHDPKFIEFEQRLNSKETKPLGDLAEAIRPGVMIREYHRKSKGVYLVLTPGNIQPEGIELRDRDYYVNDLTNSERHFKQCILRPGDILISLLGPKYKTYVYRESDPKAVANQNFAIIRAKDNRYIEAFLASETGYEIFLKQAQRRHRGGVIQRLSLTVDCQR